MNCMEDLLKEIVNEMKKDIPADVVADLEELSRLEAEVHSSMLHNRIVDTGKVKRINELIRKHYYHGEQEKKATVETFDFGEAIQRLKNGARVACKGWNGKGMFVMFFKAGGGAYTLPNGMKVTRRDYLYMKAADNTIVPWVASQTDILSEDWYEVKG